MISSGKTENLSKDKDSKEKLSKVTDDQGKSNTSSESSSSGSVSGNNPQDASRSASSGVSDGPARVKRPKKIACTECRQQKARCDASEKVPGPCTRCARRGIQCVLNSDYKRTFKRVQIAQMERDYEMMKRRLQYTPTSNVLSTASHSADGLRTNNPSLLSEQVRTWIACNVVSQIIATAFGFPSLNRLDLPGNMDTNGLQLPKELKQMFAIQRFESQAAQTLNSNSFDPLMLVGAQERFPLLRLLETELDQLEMRLNTKGDDGQMDSGSLDDFRLLSLLAAKLHLLTYYFLDTDKVPGYDLKKGLFKAYDAAVQYIAHFRESQKRNPLFAKNSPSVYTLTIWQAACIVARLIHSPYMSLLDVSDGRKIYLDAVYLAHHASVIKHDMPYRASGIMRSMWALFKTLCEQNSISPNVIVRSRMSASVFFDSLWIVRQKCGMVKLRPERVEDQVIASDGNDDDDEDDDDDEEEDGKGNKSADKRKVRMQRSLSSTLHPESDARKIISTIPLDPQPISLSDRGESGSSSHSSPFIYRSPREKRRLVDGSNNEASGVSEVTTPISNIQKSRLQNSESTDNTKTEEETPVFSLDSWDLAKDIDSELLFKDIDNVMNNFGFHAE
ncbi:hypothetical protein FOA43_001487 [Brettanomyces nanus]|uniref:Zn(2)-C6 fungal-type domain-containing protein n=1 Tax=Eeniella nana TaxID=13502 RepID=A0A875RZS6_EENNA|nr:uncharacterized protein FOA43_001487 [Brettanomyces nanus]QPG74163.1 hypothetical protein FOA43_001487 [Brettanomyces nanus]